ncbi:hypothetical protein L7F22_040485 [Adiantum nelumboides]|nr:hypothetical protein [Adiantum nelumboides]
MADQRRVQPLGILRNLLISVGGLQFVANFVVLRLEESTCSYPLMLGRPWLRAARVKQLWGADAIVIKRGKKKVKMQMDAKKVIPPGFRALHAEGLNMVEEFGEDAEEEFLRNNSSVVPIFEVDVQKIANSVSHFSEEERGAAGLLGWKLRIQTYIHLYMAYASYSPPSSKKGSAQCGHVNLDQGYFLHPVVQPPPAPDPYMNKVHEPTNKNKPHTNKDDSFLDRCLTAFCCCCLSEKCLF